MPFIFCNALEKAGITIAKPINSSFSSTTNFMYSGFTKLINFSLKNSFCASVISTKDDNDPSLTNQVAFKSETKAFLLGGKVRLTAPIPWVAPFVEIGIGMSVGEFETVTPLTNIEENGLLFHIPVSFGLELGRKHNFDIAFTYYFHNGAEQFAGAAAFGVTFPLN